ncbi:hypothetical protein [Alkalibaculum sporogenes]|nr:hypothetical protein [Alkalibaculum sporogenes]
MKYNTDLYKTDDEIIKEYNLTEDEKVYLLPALRKVEDQVFNILIML